jgi:hypothetical protein
VQNPNDVSRTAVTGGLWHAQSVTGPLSTPSMRNLGYAAARLVDVRNARIDQPAVVAFKATAKQAPQSRRSSAHP